MRKEQPTIMCDRDAFLHRLHAQYASQLLRRVRRYTDGDRQWAEDVVQETMLRAWRHADLLQKGGYPSLLPWLVTVARRVVSNDRRAMRRHLEAGDEMLATLAAPDQTNAALERALVSRALAGLSKPYHDVIVAVYLYGYPMHDVAGALNVPVGTVKSRLYYALRALRATLSGER